MTTLFGACPCCGVIGNRVAPGQSWIDGYNEGYTIGERSAAARVEWALKEERAMIATMVEMWDVVRPFFNSIGDTPRAAMLRQADIVFRNARKEVDRG
jgi:hypothetical protein